MTFLLYFSLFYAFMIFCLIIGILRCFRSGGEASEQKNFISVIIACKNEESNIINLIKSLKNQTYHKDHYEVIFADDGSTDSTADIIKQNIKDVRNFHYLYVEQNAYPDLRGKKKAISYAIEHSFTNKEKILAFTDADCTPEKDWLWDINQAFINGCDFYAGYSPIHFEKSNIFTNLKNIERASIFAVSAAGFGLGIPLTCTARNMAYKSSIWIKSEGFLGIGHILSGDDDLMLHKARHFIDKYHFSFHPNAFVTSFNENKLNNQIAHETRRASKFIHYPPHIKLLIVFVTIFYLFLLYQIVVSVITLSIPFDLTIAIASKILLEFTLLSIFLMKVNKLNLMKSFFLAELFYIPYFLFFGIKGTLGKYKWKN